MSDIRTIVDYFKNILDVPNYYFYQSDPTFSILGIFDLYAHIGNVKIYLTETNLGYHILKSDVVINNSIVITDDVIQFRLLLPIDDYCLLVINDIIKSFGGIIL